MSNGVKLTLLFIVCAVVFIIFRAVNSNLDKAADTINEEVKAQGYPINPEIPAATAVQQVYSAGEPAINVIGVAAVEKQNPEYLQEGNKNNRIFQSQSSASANTRQGDLASPAPASGITVNKEPAKEEKKKMGDKGIVIF